MKVDVFKRLIFYRSTVQQSVSHCKHKLPSFIVCCVKQQDEGNFLCCVSSGETVALLVFSSFHSKAQMLHN